MGATLLSFAGFQLVWFACILGARAGRPWIGPLVAALSAAVQIGSARDWRVDLALAGVAALVGYAADSALVLAGVLTFPERAALGWPSPIWMVALWVNLAVTLRRLLGYLLGRYVLGAVFGAIGGPLAYLAGVQMGAARFGIGREAALAVVAVEWLVALPLLLAAEARLRGLLARRVQGVDG